MAASGGVAPDVAIGSAAKVDGSTRTTVAPFEVFTRYASSEGANAIPLPVATSASAPLPVNVASAAVSPETS